MSFVTRFPPRTIRLVAYGVLLVIAVWACIKLLSNPSSETTNDAYVTADFTLVAPRVPGQLSEVLVEDNEQVKAGQLLVRIDDRDFRAALSSAEADVATAKASVANYEAEIARQPALVDQARATLRSDDATLEFARQNALRYRNLSETGAGTTQEQQHASSALAEEIAQQARNRAVLEQAKLNLSYTEIHAPVDGKVGRRSARDGAYVTTGTSLLAIVPLSDAYVVANFQENQLTRMRPGDAVRIT